LVLAELLANRVHLLAQEVLALLLLGAGLHVVANPTAHLQLGEPQVRRRIRDDVERSEEHTSELQSRGHLVCRLLLEKKNKLMTRNNLQRIKKAAFQRTLKRLKDQLIEYISPDALDIEDIFVAVPDFPRPYSCPQTFS